LKIESLIFGIDDVLYDASQQLSASRMSAVKAMREAGLPVDLETAYRTLEEIARETGPDDTRHFDRLLERLGLKWDPAVIAAGVVAYRATSPVYLTPFPDTVMTLLKLRDRGFRLGVASKGRAVKQWQKLIQLGLDRLFHAVTISEETGSEVLDVDVLRKTLEKLRVKPGRAMFVGADLAREIAVANEARMVSVRLRAGTNRSSSPRNSSEKPAYEIARLSELSAILRIKD
jgi:putative hydrolase of the HAD superfamily